MQLNFVVMNKNNPLILRNLRDKAKSELRCVFQGEAM